MNKSIFCLAALILAAPAFAGEPRIHTTRDSGGYEATLRQSGIPLSGGMAWTGHSQLPGVAATTPQAAIKVAPSHVLVAKIAKVSTGG
ncbi:MAG TPA: hypothetical protein VLA64_03510 [Azonexus sp.]|nr:hypothetical protein [Azonexus sp.]